MFSFFNLSCIFPKKSAALIDLSSSAPLLTETSVDISGNALLEKEEENLANESKEPKEENLDKAADEEVESLYTSNIQTTYTYFTTLNDTQENQV